MSTVIKFKRSSKFESIKKISNQLLSEKEVRRIFKFKDHDVLAFKVLDNEVNEYLDFEFEDLNELDKTKNIYMRVQKLLNKTLLLGEGPSEISATSFNTSDLQESPPLNVTTVCNENIVNELHKILIKEESCAIGENLQIEILDHNRKNDKQIQDKQTQNSSESYKFPLEEISHFPNLCSALTSKNLIMGTNEDTLLRILHDSVKTQSFNRAVAYETVIDSLFMHYPYLVENYGNCKTSKNIWKRKLNLRKFANDGHSSQETRSLDDSSCLPPSKIRKLNTLEQQSESVDYGKKMASSCSKKLATIPGNANAEASQNSNDLDSVLNVNECGGYSDTINEDGSFADSDACVPDNSELNENSLLKEILERVTRTERLVEDILKDQKNLINPMNMKNKAASSEWDVAETIENMPQLPIANEDQFNSLEKILSDGENFSKFVSFLQIYGKIDSKIGSLTSSSYVLDIMSCLLTNECAEHFNWYGKRSYLSKGTKQPFAETAFWKCIKAAILKKKLENLRQGEISAINWLRQAAYRKGGSRYRQSQSS